MARVPQSPVLISLTPSPSPHQQRNGADYAVYINTGQEFDGSDSGARPDEAISWGKIRAGAENVKVYADATLVFPLVVAATFGKAHWREQAESEEKEKKQAEDAEEGK